MADRQLVVSFPFITLDAGCTITLEAIDDAGDPVAGVTLSAVTIYATNTADTAPVAEEIDRYFTFIPDEI